MNCFIEVIVYSIKTGRRDTVMRNWVTRFIFVVAALSQECTGRGWLQTFSCPVLDNFFRGGLYVRHLVEFAGAAGTGKTQFCLQLSLASQLPLECGGLGGGKH